MNIIIVGECSGKIRDAFLKKGHNAWSCDLKPTEVPGPHIQADVRDVINKDVCAFWGMMVCHPDCTYLCSSGLHWNKRILGRYKETERAVAFAKWLWGLPIEKKCMENPIGCLSTRIRKPDQIIQPYQFGHDASKATCLWLQGLPILRATTYYPPRIVGGKKRWGNQTDSGQNKLGPSETRSTDRARTYQGIADAMANQWGAI